MGVPKGRIHSFLVFFVGRRKENRKELRRCDTEQIYCLQWGSRPCCPWGAPGAGQGPKRRRARRPRAFPGKRTGVAGEKKDSVVVVMGPTSEPEAGFDPAYGWGAGSMSTSR